MKIIMISGNDGSGKSTYINSLKFEDGELVVHHFYDFKLRKAIRGKSALNKDVGIRSGRSIGKNLMFLSYHILVALYLRFSRLLSSSIIYFDRGFLDEYISYRVMNSGSYNLFYLRMIYNIARVDRIIYLDADSDLKYSRIEVQDIDRVTFMLKEKYYEEYLSMFSNKMDIKIEIINTN